MQYYQVVQGILSIPTNVLFKQQVCWFLKSVFLCKVSTVVVWIFQFLEFLGSGDCFFLVKSLFSGGRFQFSRVKFQFQLDLVGGLEDFLFFHFILWDVIRNPLTNSYVSRWAHCTTRDCCGHGMGWLWKCRDFQVAVVEAEKEWCGGCDLWEIPMPGCRHAELSRWCHGYGLEWMFMGIYLSEWELPSGYLT